MAWSPSRHSLRATGRWSSVASTTADAGVDGSATGRGIRPAVCRDEIRAASGGSGAPGGACRDSSGAPGSARRLPPPAARPVRGCLYLNVLAPADRRAAIPVMVWIYGGGFVGGSSSSPNTSGVQFARQGVSWSHETIEWPLRFLRLSCVEQRRPDENKGNYAYMTRCRLEWVRRNIAAFGGNPNNVTSLGSPRWCLRPHMLASPQARGLFQKAIVESGGSRDSVLTARPMRADG